MRPAVLGLTAVELILVSAILAVAVVLVACIISDSGRSPMPQSHGWILSRPLFDIGDWRILTSPTGQRFLVDGHGGIAPLPDASSIDAMIEAMPPPFSR